MNIRMGVISNLVLLERYRREVVGNKVKEGG